MTFTRRMLLGSLALGAMLGMAPAQQAEAQTG